MQIHNSVYKPTLIYGSGSWTMLDKHDRRIAAAEMRFLRAAEGKTKWDRVRNVTIREELKQKPLVEQIKKRELQWYGHVIRMALERKPRQILGARPVGKRRRGRPRKTWEDVVEESERQKGKTVREMDKLAKDRIRYSRWTEDRDTGR
jgi:hypothetical protein